MSVYWLACHPVLYHLPKNRSSDWQTSAADLADSEESNEQPGIVKIDGFSLRNLVVDILSQSEEETLYEKDLEGWAGRMASD